MVNLDIFVIKRVMIMNNLKVLQSTFSTNHFYPFRRGKFWKRIHANLEIIFSIFLPGGIHKINNYSYG